MVKKTFFDEKKASYWAKIMNDWSLSGLDQLNYCQRHSLSYSQFKYWRLILKKHNIGSENLSTKDNKLIPVCILSAKPREASFIKIDFSSGFSINFSEGSTIESVAHLVNLLREKDV